MAIMKSFYAGKLAVKLYATREEMGLCAAREAADRMKRLLSGKKEINVIFAAAPSQNEFLAALSADEEIEWGRIHAFHMDEYIGLSKEASQGFGNFLRERIFSKVPFKSVHYLNGNADPARECDRYAALLKEYPPDIVCMGIGENGHIAFNDPHIARFFDEERVKVVELDTRCRQQQVNDGCFLSLEEVPTQALTLTIPALLSAREIFCVVPGKTKQEAVFHTVTGNISEKCPASILKIHDHAVLYLDQDSWSEKM
jgi:glucosamine-6-phosphate deaminase